MDIYHLYHSPLDINRDYVTSVKAISRDGVVVEPMLIIKGVSHLKKWYT